MEIFFFGTGAAAPSRSRNVSGAGIRMSQKKSWYLIDCGEGTQHQILRSVMSPMDIAAIFITHAHGDHWFGLPGLLSSMSLNGREKPLQIIAPACIRDTIQAIEKLTPTHFRFEIQWTAIEDLSASVELEDTSVQVIPVSHEVPTWAFQFTEKNIERRLLPEKLIEAGIPSGPVWGEIQKGREVTLESGKILDPEPFLSEPRPARKVIIAGDNDNPDTLLEAASQADLLVHEATFTQKDFEALPIKRSHSTAEQVGKMAQRAGLKHLILTHFSSRYANTKEGNRPYIEEIREAAEQHYNGYLYLAEDFYSFCLNTQLKIMQFEIKKFQNKIN
jgi:ribonuclease Z